MVDEDTSADDFSTAFAQLTLPGEKPAPDTPIAEVVAETPEPTVLVVEAPVAEVLAPVEPVSAPVAAPVAETIKPTDEVLSRLDTIAKRLPEPPAPVPVPPPEMYTADEKESLEAYEKDWPDVAKNEAVKRRGEYAQLYNYMLGEVAKELMPLIEQVRVLTNRTHFTDLRAEIPDYDQISREKIVDWVATQPAYLQVAYNHVIQNGDTSEVKDLLTRYKQANGVVQGSAPTLPTAPAKKGTELPSATIKAVASMAPVSSKRSAVAASLDSEDFEGAFARFAAKL